MLGKISQSIANVGEGMDEWSTQLAFIGHLLRGCCGYKMKMDKQSLTSQSQWGGKMR